MIKKVVCKIHQWNELQIAAALPMHGRQQPAVCTQGKPAFGFGRGGGHADPALSVTGDRETSRK